MDKASASKIREKFNTYDEDGDGSITIAELKNGLKKDGIPCNDDAELDQLMKIIDTDGDERIDFAEFTVFYMQKMIDPGQEGVKKANLFAIKKQIPNQTELKERFSKVDTDGNGSISVDELKEAFGSSDDAEWQNFMKLADEDGDGEISFDEYVVAMMKLHLKD
ncbi:uncharacterized protein [Ptychodera flava]|uniref:uncharacterized protein n=1 Tax=Ptychodera flava TaxID=63121 RepID=UPI00396A8F7B